MTFYADTCLGVEIDKTGTDQLFNLGKIILATDADRGTGEFIYLKGVASTVVGSWVHYSADDFSTVLAVANGKGPLAIAMSANVADQYGWYQISGKASGKALASFADDADVFLTATDGSVDDADVAGDYIRCAKGASDVSGGLADFDIARPFSDDGEAN